jgi:DNA repair protein RecO (recombination protein O)
VNDLRDHAVVVRTFKSGESDRVVVLFTKSHGKVRAIAKGVRKPTSKIGSALESTALIDVLMAHGRGELLIVRQVSYIDTSLTFRDDLERLNAASALMEVLDALPLDNEPAPELFETVVRALRAVANREFYPDLVPFAFAWRVLEADGVTPIVDHCVNCGATEHLTSFDGAHGGVTCRDCQVGFPVSPEALVLLQRMRLGDLAGVLREDRPAGSDEVKRMSREALESHLGRRLRTFRPPAL